jgi:RNA polymerase sigma factor (sigma-70 family)
VVPSPADLIGRLHEDFCDQLERIAWAILRDWPLSADAVQETFALFAQKFAEIPPENRRGWLVKTVQFQSQNLRRKKRRDEGLPEQLVSRGLIRDASTENRVDSTEEHDRLRDAIASLPDLQQEVVCLRLNEELSFAEIAIKQGVPLGTVLSRMRLALEKLRASLDS